MQKLYQRIELDFMGLDYPFGDLLAEHAAVIIVTHHHPSGKEAPSEDDVTTPRQLVAAEEILGIPLRDHLIAAHAKHCSFHANGLL